MPPCAYEENRGDQPRKQRALFSRRGVGGAIAELPGRGRAPPSQVAYYSPVEYPVGVEVKVEQQLLATTPRDRGTADPTFVFARGAGVYTGAHR